MRDVTQQYTPRLLYQQFTVKLLYSPGFTLSALCAQVLVIANTLVLVILNTLVLGM